MRSAAAWMCLLCLWRLEASALTLKDQYGKEVTIGAPAADWTLVIYGDRAGSSFSGNWGNGLRTLPRCRIVFAANLHSVPFFMKGTVTGMFVGKDSKGRAKGPVLLDWNGKIGSVFGFTPSVANVYIFDRSGAMRAKDAGQGGAGDLERFTATVRTLLTQTQ